MTPYEYSVVEQIQALITDIVYDTKTAPTMSVIPNGPRNTWLVSILKDFTSNNVDEFLMDSMKKSVEVGSDIFVYIAVTTVILKDGRKLIPKSDEEYDMCHPQKHICLNCYKQANNVKFVSDRIFLTELNGDRVNINWNEYDGKTLEQIC